jgi:hypothetical protein
MCSGDDPTPILELPAFGRGYLELACAGFHAYAYVRIFFFQKKSATKVAPESRDRCYDFLNIFAGKFCEKIGVFRSKQS